MMQMAEQTAEDIDELWRAYAAEKTVDVRNRIAEHYLPPDGLPSAFRSMLTERIF